VPLRRFFSRHCSGSGRGIGILEWWRAWCSRSGDASGGVGWFIAQGLFPWVWLGEHNVFWGTLDIPRYFLLGVPLGLMVPIAVLPGAFLVRARLCCSGGSDGWCS